MCVGKFNLNHARQTDDLEVDLEVDLNLIPGGQDTLSAERESKNRSRKKRDLSRDQDSLTAVKVRQKAMQTHSQPAFGIGLYPLQAEINISLWREARAGRAG